MASFFLMGSCVDFVVSLEMRSFFLTMVTRLGRELLLHLLHWVLSLILAATDLTSFWQRHHELFLRRELMFSFLSQESVVTALSSSAALERMFAQLLYL